MIFVQEDALRFSLKDKSSDIYIQNSHLQKNTLFIFQA